MPGWMRATARIWFSRVSPDGAPLAVSGPAHRANHHLGRLNPRPGAPRRFRSHRAGKESRW